MKLAYSVPEVCEMVGVSRPTIDRMIRAGELAAIKVADRVLIRHEELTRFLDSRPAA